MWSVKLYTVSLCFCNHFRSILPFSYYLEPYNTLRNVDHSLLCCLWHHSFTNSAMCSLGATMEQCCPCLVLCVLSVEKGCDKAHLLLSEVLPGSHTLHTSESPVCSLSSALILFIFLTRGTKTRQK